MMFRIWQVLLILPLAVFSAAAAHGQRGAAGASSVTVTVPFDFEAGGQAMPAGRYEFQRDEEWGVMLLCRDGAGCACVQTRAGRAVREHAEPMLLFTVDGARRRLALVQYSGREGYVFPGFPTDGARRVDGSGSYERLTARVPEIGY